MLHLPGAPSLRDLYPNLAEEELEEAEANLIEYVQQTLVMYERIRNDPESYQQFRDLTAKLQNASFEAPQKSQSS